MAEYNPLIDYANTATHRGVQEGTFVQTAHPYPPGRRVVGQEADLESDTLDLAPEIVQAQVALPISIPPGISSIGPERGSAIPQRPGDADAERRNGDNSGIDPAESLELGRDGFVFTGVDGRIRCRHCKKDCDVSRPLHKPTCNRPRGSNEENMMTPRPRLLQAAPVPRALDPNICVCERGNVRVSLLPCGHYVCIECSPQRNPARCPVCHQVVKSAHRVDPAALK